MTKQSAWEAHTRWIDDQVAQHGDQGFGEWDAPAARALAGDDPEAGADTPG